jgi:hypothetical protein
MKTLFFLITMMVGVLLASPVTTYTFGSSASTPGITGQMIAPTIGAVMPVINITKNPAWANPLPGTSWVSLVNTGDPSSPGFTEYPNGTTVLFTHTFNLPTNFVVQSAMLSVYLDDSGTGNLNNNRLYNTSSTPAPYCMGTPPGCVTSTLYTSNVTSMVTGGTNVFTTTAVQIGLSSFGANWRLDVSGYEKCDPPGEIPEPSTFAFLSLGGTLCAVAVAKRKRH